MGRLAGIGLTTAAMFLVVVAVMLANPALFYMSTAMIATIGASRLQAWLSVRALRFERTAPETVRVGDLVTIEITVWSERRIRRPLVTVLDNLPSRLFVTDLSPSLPIAPAFDIPVRTQYRFRPMKRGVYRWSGLRASGTDALGLVTLDRFYPTAPVEMIVLPVPIPVSVQLPSAAAWGLAATDGNLGRGAGIEPRGTREYVPGDPLKHVHWRSSAKTGVLLVKEFEAGIQASFAYLLQRTAGTEIGKGARTTLELMCGHAAYVANQLLRSGADVVFPGIEQRRRAESDAERANDVLLALARLEGGVPATLGDDLGEATSELGAGTTVLMALAVVDATLPAAVRRAAGMGIQVVALLYDADAFAPPKGRAASATDPPFVKALQVAGARTVRMPSEGLTA